ncbi:MAG: tRNA 2-thiouridine(34) synthase MnmA, partial [Ruminiclostridium sp.]|nr:tRNA 2-thiouridine(34) synthase MnmA [Ruminiclostridium sp.]
FSCKAKTRYKQTEQPCRVTIEGDRATVIFDEPIRAVTPGQHIVFYDGDTVLGGGVIC